MKKQFKKVMLSALITAALATASTATIFAATAMADENVARAETTKFEMVDGAAIRLSKPYGLRFIAEMDKNTYSDLMKKEAGVVKQMGMFIVPYDYLNRAEKYSNGATGVENQDYAQLTQKINHVFYNSEEDFNKIYQEGDFYRANGVIANLKSQNFDREFVGIAYISETKDGVTTYTYADFDAEDDVRSAVYVAIEAYNDYADVATARTQLDEYIWGAHVTELFGDAIVEEATGEGAEKSFYYTYDGVMYSSFQEMCEETGIVDSGALSVSINGAQTTSCVVTLDAKRTLNFTAFEQEQLTFNDLHAVWASSNEKVATVDKNGVVTAVGSGTATITASFMGEMATCTVSTFDGTFETVNVAPSYFKKADTTESLDIVSINGNNVLKLNNPSSGSPAMKVAIEFLEAFFSDENVDYIAFDAIADKANNNFRRDTKHSSGALNAVTYEHDMTFTHPVDGATYPTTGVRADAWKTFYFSRADYDFWVSKGATEARFIASGGFAAGENIYLDNIRPAMAAERELSAYSFESVGIRVNDAGAKTLLFYTLDNGGTWQFNMQSGGFTNVGLTNDNVTDGRTALTFTKAAGTLSINFPGDKKPYKELITKTGYWAIDVFISVGAGATISADSTGLSNSVIPCGVPAEGAWTTIYLNGSTNSLKIVDTNGGTYVIDNMRSITAEEYTAAQYGFEIGTVGLRTNKLNGADAHSGEAHVYYKGSDYSNVKASITIAEGNGAGDVNAISNVRFDNQIVHGGDYSLAFDKGAGYMYFTRHGESEALTTFAGGFTFWLYSTVAIDGVGTNNIVNGVNGKVNGGVGATIPANTWTKLIVTANEIGSGRFLILQGNWSGTIYIDDFELLDASALNTITYNANGGNVASTTQTVMDGEAYTLATPTAPKLYQDFLGWKDENGNTIPMSGVWEYGNVTLTASYGDKMSFEGGVVPTYLTKGGSTESLSVVTLDDATDGNKVLKIQSTASGTSPGLNVTLEFLASFFEDSNVDYIAFDAKTGKSNTNNFRRSKIRASSGAWGQDTYESDYAPGDTGAVTGVRYDAFKTFFFTRSDYNDWVNNNKTTAEFITSGGMQAGDCIYVDNIRAVTAEAYTASKYSLDNGGTRTNGGNLLMYAFDNTGAWQLGVLKTTTGFTADSFRYTNEIVSDGIRAFQFKTYANETATVQFNNNSMYQTVNATGYYAFDLYVPAGANATLTYNTTTWLGATPNYGDWMTIYVNNNATCIKITDTTGSWYTIDNFRSVTAEEYTAATLGFEAGAGGLRDNVAEFNAFYYYGGADHTANKYSFAVTGTPLESVRLDSEIVHSGDYSLAFTKENGTIAVQMRKDNAAYALLKNGFTFWIYSTVGINGIGANNFINGNEQKFNDGKGMSISANKWTQVTVTAKDIKHATAADGACPFLRIQGSTAGTIYLDDFVALPYEEPEALEYNATVETEEDGVRKGIVLGASSHTAGFDVLPKGTADTEDMSYIRFGGEYGLNDFLVFDFTGDNVPLMSFFTTEAGTSVYNQEENAEVKGWIVANGMTTMRGLPYSGTTSNLANRLNIIGPYKISNLYDNTTGNTLAQVRASEDNAANPSPITMPTLQAAGNVPYRMIVGWVENGSEMNLRMYVIDLSNGQTYLEYNLDKNIAKADWEGDIVLYGHFARETVVDALYPIEEDTDIETVVEKYKPSTVVYKGEWQGEQLTLNASTYSGSPNRPNVGSTDMSYIAFNGDYGYGDYLVFDFTGSNMPFVSFFNNEVTNTVYNNASTTADKAGVADENAHGIVVCGGLYQNNKSIYNAGGSNACRLIVIGNQKVLGWDDNSNTAVGGGRYVDGSTSAVNPLSVTALQNVTDTYRIIIGFSADKKLEVCAINMVTGAMVYRQTLSISCGSKLATGAIAMHGQFGTGTVLDRVFGVEEDTTIDALLAKYAKDVDYSDEAAVTLDRYAYNSLSNGQWTLDGENQVSNPTDFRLDANAYTTYKNAGFNIVLAQDMISTDGNSTSWNASDAKTYMNNAQAAGLKVILTDWHLQILSAPIKVTSSGAAASDKTYKPWIIGTDASATTGEAAKYLGYLSSLGITADSTRFKNRDELDKFVHQQLEPYMNHPAFYGVMLTDEPSYHNAYCYGEIYKSIKRVMPKCYVQYNLLPMEHNFSTIQYRYPGVNNIGSGISNAQIEAAYKSYVTSFLDTMGTDYIQYDDYPFKSAEEGVLFWKETVPYVDVTSLRNIQLVVEIAKERNLDVKVVSQSCVMRTSGSDGPIHIRQVTENDARWLNNYLMGFGVKQINYFTYWTKSANSTSGEYFVDGGSFVNRDGTPTALYTFMQTIMADNDKFAPTISHFDYNASQVFGSDNNSSKNNEHISWSSSLTAAAKFRFVSSVTTSLEYTLVTELYDEENYNYMYMVMNTIDPNDSGTQSITVTLKDTVKKFYVYDQRGNRTLVEGNTYTVSLTAGQAVYLMPCAW